MTLAIQGHFDGKVIVPDEPVDLPIGEKLSLNVGLLAQDLRATNKDERRVILEEFFEMALPGGPIPAEALRREYIYEDRE